METPLDLSAAVDLSRHPEMEAEMAFIAQVLNQDQVEMAVFAQAAGFAERALSREPGNAMLVFILGTLYLKAEKNGLAECLLRYSLSLKWSQASALNLSFLLQSTGRSSEASAILHCIVEENPTDTRALANLSGSYVNVHDPDEAIKWADKLLEIDPQNSDALWNKSLSLLEKGEWEEGWKLYRHGATLDVGNLTQRKRRSENVPYWDGSKEATVFVYGEQGVGDEIMGYGMVSELIEHVSGRVVLETHPRLVTIARAAFGDRIPIYGTRKCPEGELTWPANFQPTHRIPLLGLAEFFRSSGPAWQEQHIPYLQELLPENVPEVVDAPMATLRYGGSSRVFTVGLSWAGGSAVTKAADRSVPLDMLVENVIEKFDGNEIDWVSLQYDPADNPGAAKLEIDRVNAKYGINIRHNQEIANDLTLCYGRLLPSLDAVVTVCTSLVHAAGAFCTVPTFVMTPHDVAWRYGLEGRHMPIYGQHIRTIRQEIGKDWDPVFKQVCDEIRNMRVPK